MIAELRIWVCNFIICYIPFHFIRLAFYRYIMKFEIGNGSSILLGCKFNAAKNFKIGENSTINQYCHLDNRGGIYIGDNVSIGPYCKIITADHDVNHANNIGRAKKTILKDFVFVGADALILGGLILETASVLGARSLLTKSTQDYGIYFGIPAALKYKRIKTLNYNCQYRRLFH